MLAMIAESAVNIVHEMLTIIAEIIAITLDSRTI